MEIGWDDILQEDSGKGIFDMELEDVNDAADDNQDGDEVRSYVFWLIIGFYVDLQSISAISSGSLLEASILFTELISSAFKDFVFGGFRLHALECDISSSSLEANANILFFPKEAVERVRKFRILKDNYCFA